MPQSFSSLWVHLVWTTKNREPIITKDFKHELYQIINEITADHEIYLDCINGIEDHVHLLVRLRTDQSIADIVKTIKGKSWEHFKDQTEKYIRWQDGFGAFTISQQNLKAVRGYIYNQEKHHKDRSFNDEMKMIKEEIKRHS